MNPMILNEGEYYNKVYGCWLGKNCGVTIRFTVVGLVKTAGAR